MNEFVCAPVVIPTLCRHNHLMRCIESLKKNKYAKYTELYIGVDYPANDTHVDGYKKICKYLEGNFDEFLAVHIYKREYNFGVSNNIRALFEVVTKKYEKFIFSEDDIEFSSNYLEYMNSCLDYYEEDSNAIAVAGYSHPLKWRIEKGKNVFKNNFIHNMWGVGLWTKKFLKVNNDLENGYLRKKFNEFNFFKAKGNMIDARLCSFIESCLNNDHNLIDVYSDMSCASYLYFDNKYVISPIISKVRNCGFDGTGVHCTNNSKVNTFHALFYDYGSQDIDCESIFILNPDNNFPSKVNRDLMNDFFSIDAKMQIKIFVKFMLKRYFNYKW